MARGRAQSFKRFRATQFSCESINLQRTPDMTDDDLLINTSCPARGYCWRAQLADAAGHFLLLPLLPQILELCTLREKACICHINRFWCQCQRGQFGQLSSIPGMWSCPRLLRLGWILVTLNSNESEQERRIRFIFMGVEMESGGEGWESLGSSWSNVGRLRMMCRYSRTL